MGHWCLMAVLIQAGSKAAVATTLGAAAGAMINYFAQKQFTFRSNLLHRQTLPRYIGICIFLWVSNLGLFLIVTKLLFPSIALAQLITTLLVALLGYLSFKGLVFNDGY